MILFAIGAAIYYFVNQETVPLTGRKQLRTMDTDQEMALGLQSYKQILSDSRVLSPNEPAVQAIREIGDRLARTADEMLIEETGEPSGFDWAVNVIDSDQANAFALPGGYSAVYTGLIPIAQNEDGLAVIMGHEIAHALAHHGAERMAQQNMQRIVGAGVSLGAGGMDYGAQRAVMGVFGGISQYGYALPFSRKHEMQADDFSYDILFSTGQRADGLIRFFEEIEKEMPIPESGEWMMTHPLSQKRIENIEAKINRDNP